MNCDRYPLATLMLLTCFAMSVFTAQATSEERFPEVIVTPEGLLIEPWAGAAFEKMLVRVVDSDDRLVFEVTSRGEPVTWPRLVTGTVTGTDPSSKYLWNQPSV